MVFTSGEGVEAGEAGELPAAGRTSARPNPRTEGRKGCGPVPGSPGWGSAAFLPTPGHSRPSHRQFSALGLRLPVAVTITICKALPVDAPRADPTARCGRAGGAAPGVPGPGLTVSWVRGPPGASQLRQGGGGGGVLGHRVVPATAVPQPWPLPPLPGPGRAGKSNPYPCGTADDLVPER